MNIRLLEGLTQILRVYFHFRLGNSLRAVDHAGWGGWAFSRAEAETLSLRFPRLTRVFEACQDRILLDRPSTALYRVMHRCRMRHLTMLVLMIVLNAGHALVHGTPLDGGSLDTLLAWVNSQVMASSHDQDEV